MINRRVLKTSMLELDSQSLATWNLVKHTRPYRFGPWKSNSSLDLWLSHLWIERFCSIASIIRGVILSLSNVYGTLGGSYFMPLHAIISSAFSGVAIYNTQWKVSRLPHTSYTASGRPHWRELRLPVPSVSGNKSNSGLVGIWHYQYKAFSQSQTESFKWLPLESIVDPYVRLWWLPGVPHLKIDRALPNHMDLGRQELAARALYLVWHSGIITAIVGIPLV